MPVRAPLWMSSDFRLDPMHKRTFSDFWFEHVKLFVAILTAIAVLSLVIITDVTGWVDDIREKIAQKETVPLSMEHVRALSDRGAITWEDMRRYERYNTNTANESVTWCFYVEGTHYEVWISGVDTAQNPTYVYLYDMSTGEHMDLQKDILDLFLDPVMRPAMNSSKK